MKVLKKIAIASILFIILIRAFVPYFKVIINHNLPQLIFVLGGDIDREIAGMEIAKKMNLPLLISGGSNPEYSDWLIKSKGMSSYLISKD